MLEVIATFLLGEVVGGWDGWVGWVGWWSCYLPPRLGHLHSPHLKQTHGFINSPFCFSFFLLFLYYMIISNPLHLSLHIRSLPVSSSPSEALPEKQVEQESPQDSEVFRSDPPYKRELQEALDPHEDSRRCAFSSAAAASCASPRR